MEKSEKPAFETVECFIFIPHFFDVYNYLV